MSVASSAAAESPNPAPIGRVDTVTTDAVISRCSITCSSNGDSEEISDDISGENLRLMQIDILSEGLTLAVTPSLMTIPAPILPVVATDISPHSFEIAGNMTRTECGDVSWLHGLMHNFIIEIGCFSSLKNPGEDWYKSEVTLVPFVNLKLSFETNLSFLKEAMTRPVIYCTGYSFK